MPETILDTEYEVKKIDERINIPDEFINNNKSIKVNDQEWTIYSSNYENAKDIIQEADTENDENDESIGKKLIKKFPNLNPNLKWGNRKKITGGSKSKTSRKSRKSRKSK